MTDDSTLRDVAARLVAELAAAGKTMATAESCTGGWIAKAVTDIAGSSDVIGCGIVSYSNAAKERLLGVSERTLIEHGAVSEATVREMALGVLGQSGADLAVAVSGVAGPGGGSDAKPVGTVWFAWARKCARGPEAEAERRHFDGDRDDVRRQTVLHALEGVRSRI